MAALTPLAPISPANLSAQTTQDAVIALLLVLIVASAVPQFAPGVTWLAALLLIMVWTNVALQKGK